MAQTGGKTPGPKGPDLSAVRKAQPYVDASWQLAGSIVGLTLLGYWLDGRFGTSPWLVVAGSLLGIVAGFVSFFRTIFRLAEQEKRERQQQPPTEQK